MTSREAGLSSLAGTSDFKIIASQAMGTGESGTKEDQDACKLTYDLFIDRIINFVAPYVVKILSSSSALDGIVFSGGIGEKSSDLRRDITAHFKWMGVELEEKLNNDAGKGDDEKVVWEITKEGSKIKAFMCLTVSATIYPTSIWNNADWPGE